MLYKIRWINDDTLICRESSIVMIFWLFASTYHILNDTIFSSKLCDAESDILRGGFKTSYWILFVRNMLILVLIFYYQYSVTRKHSYLQRVISTAGEHQSQVIDDFDVLLESVLPHKLFQDYLRSFFPDYMPYLKMVRLAK